MSINNRYDIGNRLRELRRIRNCTQEQVAKAVGIGRPAYGAYEEGRAEPPIPVMLRLVKFFRMQSIDQLLGEFHNDSGNELDPIVQAYLRLKPEMRKVVDFILNSSRS